MELIQAKADTSRDFIKQMNELLQESLEATVRQRDYPMKYPLPLSFTERKTIKLLGCSTDEPELISSELLEDIYSDVEFEE